MKTSKMSQWYSILAWQLFETPVSWAVWNGVIARVFNLPHLAYWEVMVILIFVSCLFPNTHSFLLGRIADRVDKLGNQIKQLDRS
jgi:hypothetical protein